MQRTKRLIPAACLIGLFAATAISEASIADDSPHVLEMTFIEFCLGRYNIKDPRFIRVYTSGREIFTLELFQLIAAEIPHHFGISAGLKHFRQNGRSTVTKKDSQLTLSPLFLGIKYLLSTNYFVPWLELGLDYYIYREESEVKTTEGHTFGYHFQGGVYVQFPKLRTIKLKIYLKHTRATAVEEDIEVNLGGMEYSAGISIGFNLFREKGK